MTWWNAVLPVVTLILGWVLSLWSEDRMETRRARRERDQQDRARELVKADRLEDFELDSLTRLHNALHRLGRATMRFHLEDVRVAKATGAPYGGHQIGDEELNEEVRLANVEVSSLIGLVVDDDMRGVVEDARGAMNALGLQQRSIRAAEQAAAAAMAQLVDAQARVSARIRAVYTGKDVTTW